MEVVTRFINAILIVGFITLFFGARIVPEYQRLVVLRLGRALQKPKGPGIVFLIPTIDHAISVDLREKVCDVLTQKAKTKDNLSVSFSFRWYYKVMDPIKSVLSINNFEHSAASFAITTLRSMIGDLANDELLSKHEIIKPILLTKLNEVTERWGVKVTNIDNLEFAFDSQQKETDNANFTWEGFNR